MRRMCSCYAHVQWLRRARTRGHRRIGYFGTGNVMKAYLLRQDVLHADETTLQVLRELGKTAQSSSYLWLYRTGSGVSTAVIYDYQKTSGGEHPQIFLSGFKGYLHVDGYAGYHKVPGVTLVGFGHMRGVNTMKR
ncbi:hypothetical protein J2T14_004665 [Paenibacillus harenae]|nr:hypothetical protein [Paenibacillus harenae]